MLSAEEIAGYLLITDSVKVVVRQSGIDETILKQVTEEIMRTAEIVSVLAPAQIQKEMMAGNFQIDYQAVYEKAVEAVQNQDANIKDISSSHLSYTMIEFYTLIAMACLYGGILGMAAINQCLANMSSNGKRMAVSPVSKGKIILSSVLAGYVTQLIGIVLLFLFTIFVLKVDYGDNLLLVIILTMAGCLAGLTMGMMIATLVKANDNVKTGIVISVTMLGCFLSGMMGITMKYIIDTNVPIVNKLNPASMITDGFYSLYYYDTYDRYYWNLASLLIFAFVMIGISIFSLRRQKYDSI